MKMTGKKSKRTLDKTEIINMYRDGYSTSEIGECANISARYVRQILTENNIPKRPRGHWKRKYDLNEDYFKTWSNNMAYILGFFVADGTIPQHAQTVSFSQKSKSILEDIKAEMGSNQPLYRNEKTGVYILNLNSKVMKMDLIQIHGIKPNKSSTIEFPHVPDKYLNHFIRGYFDGDGFVNYPKFFVSFVGGSYLFMKQLQNKLEKQGFETNFTSHATFYRVYISGRRTIKLFSDWMYTDKGLFLQRKYNEFKQEKLDPTLLKDSIKTHKNALEKRKDMK
ncbi:intein-encoded DNA endonuclease-like protein [Texcoconibacillus texcoconensis]|uniref:Intein-encoded DNA endonuclease-like protein n=2 Tax=Texcoconibacillus texcoconensis TaxID=1095777 RepID=A0A840QT56_9BACI|nr:intein-encoded DNA endonuclease-like protein [Texcoconibacillus texcoconensis]